MIWKNLILVSGANAAEAYNKARGIGHASESKRNDKVKLDGEQARTVFLGVADMGLIHDALEDGCELYFKESRSRLSTAKSDIPSKQKLIRLVAKELAPYKRIKWNPHVATKQVERSP